MFLPTVQPELCQGDIFEGIEILEPFSDPPSSAYPLLLLTNDCDIDKPKDYAALLMARVAPLALVAAVNAGKAGDIRAGRVPAAMHLRPHERLPDHFIDFRYIHRIPRDSITKANLEGRRVASMTEDARFAVVGWFHVYLARRQAPRRSGERAPVVKPTPPPSAAEP